MMPSVRIEEQISVKNYRDNVKPRRVFYLDVSDLSSREIPSFVKGVNAALKAIEEYENLPIDTNT